MIWNPKPHRIALFSSLGMAFNATLRFLDYPESTHWFEDIFSGALFTAAALFHLGLYLLMAPPRGKSVPEDPVAPPVVLDL